MAGNFAQLLEEDWVQMTEGEEALHVDFSLFIIIEIPVDCSLIYRAATD